MRRLSRLFAMVSVTAIAALAVAGEAADQSNTELAGRWVLNRQASEFPPEIGFGADFIPASGRDSRGAGGRGSAPTPDSPAVFRRVSQEDSQRRRQLTDEARQPSAYLTIASGSSAVSVTDDRERARTFHPTGKDERLELDPQVPLLANSRWETGRLLVRYKVEEGREIKYTYAAGPTQLVVDVQFVERGAGEAARRVYDRVSPDAPWPPPSPKSAPATAPAGSGGAAGAAAPQQPAPDRPAPAAFNQEPDAELKGLTKLGIVVEGLGAQAVSCGLKQDAIETAVSKSLSDAGFAVRRNADEDTYLYVNVMTSSLSSGVCVSHYDAFLYTHTTATLSYQTKPVLVQVVLLHKAGMAGGTPAVHAESLLRDLTQYVNQFAARIRAANK